MATPWSDQGALGSEPWATVGGYLSCDKPSGLLRLIPRSGRHSIQVYGHPTAYSDALPSRVQDVESSSQSATA